MTISTTGTGLHRDQFNGSNVSYHHQSFGRFADDMVELGLHNLELWGIAPHP